jgi:hypothetical protein
VPTVVAVLERDARIGTVQPNYLYRLQGAQNGPLAGNQYAGPKTHLPEAHRISNGVKTLVAVIDSESIRPIPRLRTRSPRSFDAIDGGNREAMPGNAADGMVHGTEVAGIIASHASRRDRTFLRSGLSPKAAAGPQWLARPMIFWLRPNGR